MTVTERRPRRSASSPTRGLGLSLLLIVLSAPLTVAANQASAKDENTCDACHANRDFLVTNPKLYEYYQEWSGSVHRQEGVTCDDCHGGDPTATDQTASHGAGVAESQPASGIHYTNIADTCGSCHDDILEGFVRSRHYELVEKQVKDGKALQGPTCVTCHGSISSEVLNVTSVSDACMRCHNSNSGNHAEIPDEARAILNRFLSINRFYRYIGTRAKPDEARAFLQKVDTNLDSLVRTWHSFDLEKINAQTREILTTLTEKRDELRARAKKKRNDAQNESRSK